MTTNDDDINQAISQVAKTVATRRDATERAIAAGNALEAIPGLQTELREIRQAAVQDMHTAAASWADVGSALGVTRARAKQIAEGKTENARTRRATRTQLDAEDTTT